MTLTLAPEIEARLAALAQSRGLTVEGFLASVVRSESEVSDPRQARPLTGVEWTAQFEQWADSFHEAPPVPDAALSRENLYPDRW